METAQSRNAYAFASDSVVEHLHPLTGKAPQDATYKRGGRSFGKDRRLYEQRRALWQ